MATAPTSRSAASRVALCSNTDSVAPTFSVCCASLREAGWCIAGEEVDYRRRHFAGIARGRGVGRVGGRQTATDGTIRMSNRAALIFPCG